MIKVNLQKFAEEPAPAAVEPAKELVVKPATEPEEQPGGKPKEEPKEETVPLSVFLKTKNELKEFKKKATDLENANLDSEIAKKKAELHQKAIGKGFTPEFAEFFTEQMTEIRQELKSLKAPKETLYDDDIEDLAKDELTGDAKEYKTEIIAKIKEFKDKGIEIDAETAYFKVRNPKQRLKELVLDREQKMQLKRSEGEEKEVPPSTPTQPKTQYPLDETDKKALANLQKIQPEAGWTNEKFFKLMKG